MSGRWMGRWLVVVAIVFGAALEAFAQTSTGGLRGFVRDNSDLVMVGVTVEASSPARIGGPAVAVTDVQGLYTFSNLPVGVYTLVYTLQGFTTVRREDIRVEVGRTIQVDVSLEVGSLQEAVTVTGAAPVVDAANAGFSTNFSKELLQNIPTAAPVVLRRRHLRAVGPHQPGAERLAVHHLRVEQRPEPVPVRRRGHLGGVQRRRVGFPEPRHHAGSAGQGDRRLRRVPQLPGRRRQHRHQVRQQPVPRHGQRLFHPRRLGRRTTRRTSSSPTRCTTTSRSPARSAARSRATGSGSTAC